MYKSLGKLHCTHGPAGGLTLEDLSNTSAGPDPPSDSLEENPEFLLQLPDHSLRTSQKPHQNISTNLSLPNPQSRPRKSFVSIQVHELLSSTTVLCIETNTGRYFGSCGIYYCLLVQQQV